MITQLILSILMGFVFGFVCSNLARKRGKNSLLWFQLGFFFGILALLFFYILLWKDRYSKSAKFAEERSSMGSTKTQEAPPVIEEDMSITLDKRDWYYLDTSRKQIGPISFDELKNNLDKGVISENMTYLWSEGMDKWKPMSELPYLKMVLNGETTS